MVTKLIVKTKDKEQIIQGPIVQLKTTLNSSIQDNKITLSLGDFLDTLKTGYITSINQLPPDDFNNIQLLGDMCTSVVTDIDPDSGQFGSKDITLFDGCQSCSTCDSVASIQNDLKNLQIWLSGLKDCQLYYEGGAYRLWNQMIQKKNQNMSYIGACGIQSKLDRQFKAIRLLYQYKALVYMWNYLVFLKSGNTQIISAYESYTGFVVRSKRAIDTCGSIQAPQIKLHIQIQLVQGQLPQSLKDLSMYVYTQKVQQNTLIQVTSPTGSIEKQASIQCSIQVQGTHIKAVIGFKPEQTCKGIYSGGIKILPVIGAKDVPTGKQGLEIEQYVKLVNKANYITQQQQLKVNRWQAKVWWQYPNFGSSGDIDDNNSSQTKIYTTGYCTYPKDSKNENGFFK